MRGCEKAYPYLESLESLATYFKAKKSFQLGRYGALKPDWHHDPYKHGILRVARFHGNKNSHISGFLGAISSNFVAKAHTVP